MLVWWGWLMLLFAAVGPTAVVAGFVCALALFLLACLLLCGLLEALAEALAA